MLLFILLFALWLIWNGRLTLEIVGIGLLLSAGLLALLHRFMGYALSPRREIAYLKVAGLALVYLWKLLLEIVKCNRDVAAMILNFQEEPEPEIVCFSTDVESETGQVVVANSITLTPGTLTVDMDDGVFMVHCLDRTFSEGIETNEFVREVKEMEDHAKGGRTHV